eukprot:CAMPEP_0176208620 /NCGR_PEP_ID=MMETSP0121_2-20121125/13218_1 /TAXON_ID=160619 /ORGANISM="Kryptoperidinium foliaceum, Strain CCMP 1326" /LENGTH=59 /DNA_ID=CAMNT_0017547619 /DNA_START=124 /DNA_END=300 /DNA_ORIENTATION=-
MPVPLHDLLEEGASAETQLDAYTQNRTEPAHIVAQAALLLLKAAAQSLSFTPSALATLS